MKSNWLVVVLLLIIAALLLVDAGVITLPSGGGNNTNVNTNDNTTNSYIQPTNTAPSTVPGTPTPNRQATDAVKRANDIESTRERIAREATRDALRETLKTPHAGRN